MNKENWRKSDKDCNVCGASVEVGTATSRCSNRRCITRDRDCSLHTNSTDEEQAAYWEDKYNEAQKEVALTTEELKEAALSAFEDYVLAVSREDAEEAEIRCDTYLSHLEVGWGWLKEESDAV